MTTFYIEAGINHFGKAKEANKILNYFLKSKFTNLTFMIQTNEFYSAQKSKGLDFQLSKSFYEQAIKKCHKNKKKIGLSVCSLESFEKYKNLDFDFYKLLSIAINNFGLIEEIKKKNKPVYISTGINGTDTNIKKCLKSFKPLKKLHLLHTPMTYNLIELNLSRINDLRNKFNLPVGFSNHNNDKNILNFLIFFKPAYIFVYCKTKSKNKRVYPDDGHAFFFDELDKILINYFKYLKLSLKSKKIKKVNIFANEFKF